MRLSDIPRPLIAPLQTIEMGSGQPPLMLHAPHHDGRCNAHGLSRRNQLIRSEAIDFGLMLFIHSSEAIHDRGLVNQVRSLVLCRRLKEIRDRSRLSH